MQENISLSIQQLTRLLQNNDLSSKQSSLNTLAPMEKQQMRRNIPKIVSFIDIDEFQETSTSSVFQNSENLSLIERIHELEVENKELKETIIEYKVKEYKWNNEKADYQNQSKELLKHNEILQARYQAIHEEQVNFQKETKQFQIQQKNNITTDINQIQCQKKHTIETQLQVRKYKGPSGLKNSSPHRMFSEKKTDRTLY